MGFVVFYATWHAEMYFCGVGRITLFYGLPSVISVVCFVALRSAKKNRDILAIIILTVGVTSYGFELYIRHSGFLTSTGSVTGCQDKRSRIEVIQDLQKKDIPAVPSISASTLLGDYYRTDHTSPLKVKGKNVLPLAGISHAYTVGCNESGQWVHYFSDGWGFNNPEGMERKANGRPEIAAVGDSFVHGACVRPDENFIGFFRKHYPESLNFGIGGSGPLVYLGIL